MIIYESLVGEVYMGVEAATPGVGLGEIAKESELLEHVPLGVPIERLDEASILVEYPLNNYSPPKGDVELLSHVDSVYKRVRGIIREHFSAFDQDPALVEAIVVSPYSSGWYFRDRLINLDSRRVSEQQEQVAVTEQMSSLIGVTLRRDLADMVILFHELMHVYYYQMVTLSEESVTEVHDSADRMLSEGLATFMDFLLVGVLTAFDEEDLSEEDVTALNQLREMRIQGLKEQISGKDESLYMHRIEGFNIFEKIFNTVLEYSESFEAFEHAIEAIATYLASLDRAVLLSVPRLGYHDQYTVQLGGGYSLTINL